MAEKKDEVKNAGGEFGFSLILNGNVVCGKRFGIRTFNRESTNSLEFLTTCRECVDLIKSDLASKSRIAMAIYDGRLYDSKNSIVKKFEDGHMLGQSLVPFDTPDEEFNKTIDEGECIFEFVVFKNDKKLFSECWDGCVYPEIVRKHIDIVNDVEKFDDGDGILSFKSWLYREMSVGKENLVPIIMERIKNVCRPENVEYDEDGKVLSKSGMYSRRDDYTLSDTYYTVDEETGNDVDMRQYSFGYSERENDFNNWIRPWEKKLNRKKYTLREFNQLMELRDSGKSAKKNKKN